MREELAIKILKNSMWLGLEKAYEKIDEVITELDELITLDLELNKLGCYDLYGSTQQAFDEAKQLRLNIKTMKENLGLENNA